MPQKSPKIELNGQVLKWVRSSSGLTLEEVVQKLHKIIKGISNELILSWEDGSGQPTFNQLSILSTIYKRPIAVFLLKNPPTEEPLPKDFRTLGSKRNSELSYEIRIAIRWARQVQSVSSSIIDKPDKLFKYKRIDIRDDIELVANNFRTEFDFTLDKHKKISNEEGLFEFLRNKIESTGVIVLKSLPKYSFPLSQARALSFVDKEPYVILINNKDITQAKIFSLMHEFGHILLRESSLCSIDYFNSYHSDVIEIFCNKFASNFLLPDQVIKAYSLTPQDLLNSQLLDDALNNISHIYKLSKSFVLLKLFNLGYIDKRVYDSKVAYWRQNPPPENRFGKNVPHITAFKANGETYSNLILSAYKSDRITYSDALEYLNIKAKHLPKLESLVFNR